MIVGVNPCTAIEAITRMRSMVGVDMPYRYGTGDYAPRLGVGGVIDVPWTEDAKHVCGGDCAGCAICYAYKLKRRRVGFNRNKPGMPRRPSAIAFEAPTVVDDINTNSAIEDAEYAQELFTIVPVGDPILAGDLIMYPTIQLRDPKTGDWMRYDDGRIKQWIGHVQMALDGQGAKAGGPYDAVIVAQCCGPEDRRPAIIISNASHMDDHDRDWPKEEHRVKVVRVRSDIAIVG